MNLAHIELMVFDEVVAIAYQHETEDMPSLTNLIEQVMEAVVKLHDPDQFIFIYRDSEGIWDAIRWENGQMIGFRSLGMQTDIRTAVDRARVLRKMTRQPSLETIAGDALDLLNLDKSKGDRATRLGVVLDSHSNVDALNLITEGLCLGLLNVFLKNHDAALRDTLTSVAKDQHDAMFALLDKHRQRTAAQFSHAAPGGVEMRDLVQKAADALMATAALNEMQRLADELAGRQAVKH
jgi:hypothetical protein